MHRSITARLLTVGMLLGGSLAACAPTATSESTGAYVDDASITTKVKAALLDDTGLKVFDIHVLTEKDVVELSGFVDSPSTVRRAGNIAGSIAGVRGVRNDLLVR
jgi:osmotically-inducible protein OsmY